MSNFESFNIPTKVHGSYLIRESKNRRPSPLLIGFHGYGETAEDQLQLLQHISGIENWIVCSAQALHPFYNTRAKIGYCWMTSQNRELHIKENVEYVNRVITEIKNNYPVNDTIVFHGFSQGTAMACRAALLGKFKSSGVILLGGDIPPEFDNLHRINRILLARGKRDKFYSSVRWKKDIARVKHSNIESHICEFDGGHGGHENYYKAVGEFLEYYK
jgi:predicted esterase